ncbi:hypothetical protein Zmor_000039 [Zophobas morio]|uniref:Uncharacterized protein n=1 Tax=Zophobas morio TaxID=2755281 RepID=A0AA38MPZ8_9CUCU|nr:hypothetical protein Zmor_000039 [Zophobas morio]
MGTDNKSSLRKKIDDEGRRRDEEERMKSMFARLRKKICKKKRSQKKELRYKKTFNSAKTFQVEDKEEAHRGGEGKIDGKIPRAIWKDDTKRTSIRAVQAGNQECDLRMKT